MARRSQTDSSSIPNIESQLSSHCIYTGSFAALEIRWMEVIAELQRNNPLRQVDILIGSNILASYLKRCLAENGQAAANVRFHTFLDLSSRLAAASGYAPTKPHLPRMGPSIILAKILEEHAPSVFAPISGYQGFRDALLDTFRDLRDAGIGAKELDLVVQTAHRSPDRQRHLSGFADLYRRFREQAGLFHDGDDDFRVAIENAKEAQSSLGCDRLLVYGIYDATGQQTHLLAALKNSLKMNCFIPFVNETVSGFAQPFLETCQNVFGVAPIPLKTQPSANSLGQLRARDFGFSRDPGSHESLGADGSFSIVSAPGESRSALEIVREIFRAVRDGTVSGFHEAAVILRQPESDLPVLTEMLRLHKVPYFVQGGEPFADRPLSKAVVALSNLETKFFSRESVLVCMELVAASLPENSAEIWDVQSWRALTNDPRFLAGLHSWDAGTQAIIEREQRELNRMEAQPIEAIEDESEAGVQSVHAVRSRLECARHLRSAWMLLRQASADWPARMSWQDWARLLEQRLEPLLGASSDWPSFSTVLDEIESLHQLEIANPTPKAGEAQSAKVPVEKLKAALVESISALSCPAGRFQRSGVNLLSISSARGLRFPLVIIPGLEEGRFPAKLRQDPLLPDSERQRMKSLPVKSKRNEEEKLLFDMTARSARKRLVLMTSRLDESSDRERIPSQFLLRVAAAVRGGVVTIRDLTQNTIPGFRSGSLEAPAPVKDEVAIDEGEIRLRLITAEQDLSRRVLAALAQMEPHRLSGPLAYDHDRWINQLTKYDGRIFNPELNRWIAQKIGASAGQVSASRIEEYAKCPYYFFLKRVMELEAWEEQGQIEGMNPLERGLAIHSILESFLKNSEGEIFRSTSMERLQQLMEQLAGNNLEKARPAGLPDLLWEIERDTLIAMLQRWVEFEKERAKDGMRIVRLEQSFGAFGITEQLAAFSLKAGRHTFNFRGRIDRVDIDRDGKHARIIDYKTGVLPDSMSGKKRTPLMSGERIQVAIYRGALSILEGFENLETAEGEYLHLQPRDGQIVSCRYTDEQLNEALQALPDVLEIVGDGIESGVFFPRTSGAVRSSGHCDYCDYLTICGKDRVQREVRKANDPAVQKFLRIQEP